MLGFSVRREGWLLVVTALNEKKQSPDQDSASVSCPASYTQIT